MSASFELPDNLPPVPWTPHDVMWGMVTFVGWMVTVVLVGQLITISGFNVDPSLVVIFGTALLILPAWYFTIYKYGVGWANLGLRRFKASMVGLGCGLMLASLLFNLVYGAILGIFGLQIQPDMAIMFDGTSFPLALLFGGAVVAPVVEEIFFRGFIFAGLKHRWRWPVAAAVSAGLFAVAHVIPTSILPIFILGFIFAFLYQASGSIWPAIIMHMLTNTVALTAAYLVSQGMVSLP